MTVRKPLTIALAEVDVDNRIQHLDEAKAGEIAASILLHSKLLQPIGLRQTPKGAKGWRLVFGRHRLRALELNGVEQLVEGEHFVRILADAAEGQMIEVEENLARTDTTPFARALMLVAYRDASGIETARGGDRKSDDYRQGVGTMVGSFTAHAMSVFDLSSDQQSRLLQIGTRLGKPAGLADRLQGSRIARNQSQLLKLAALPEEQLARAAEAFDAAKGDFFNLMAILSKAPAAQAKLLGKLQAGAPIGDVVEAEPEKPVAYDHFKQAVSSFSQLNHQGRKAAVLEHFRLDEKAVRAALKSLGYELVRVGE